jgi:hypothetical protein
MTNHVLNFIINFGINNLKQKEKEINSLFVTIYCFLFLENQIFQNMHGNNNNNNIFARDIKIIMIVFVKLMIIMKMLKKVMVVKELDKNVGCGI